MGQTADGRTGGARPASAACGTAAPAALCWVLIVSQSRPARRAVRAVRAANRAISLSHRVSYYSPVAHAAAPAVLSFYHCAMHSLRLLHPCHCVLYASRASFTAQGYHKHRERSWTGLLRTPPPRFSQIKIVAPWIFGRGQRQGTGSVASSSIKPHIKSLSCTSQAFPTAARSQASSFAFSCTATGSALPTRYARSQASSTSVRDSKAPHSAIQTPSAPKKIQTTSKGHGVEEKGQKMARSTIHWKHVSPGKTAWETRKTRRLWADLCEAYAVAADLSGGRRRRLTLICDAGSPPCPNACAPGETRCKWHGGRSTGPRTQEGKAASVAGRQALNTQRLNKEKAGQ